MPLPTDLNRGFLHSLEAGSAVDGPGIRLVLFMSGCLLRCQFCHNPDTWSPTSGWPISADEMMLKISSYSDFLKVVRGGVTFTGGEPMFQWPFMANILRRTREEHGLHLAIQTAGFLQDRVPDNELSLLDLWMVDIKSALPNAYKQVTGVDQAPMLKLLHRLQQRGQPTWATYVLVPDLTDSDEQLHALGELIAPMKNVERLELRPFHQLGRDKWRAMSQTYPLEQVGTPSPATTERAAEIIRGHGVNVIVA
jgi:pyruvate formate lyase activating enzyme